MAHDLSWTSIAQGLLVLAVPEALGDHALVFALAYLAMRLAHLGCSGCRAATGVAGYRVHPAHFVERFALIVSIALGGSIVAIGVGAGGEPLDAAIAVAAVLALGSAGLWWAYFDVVAPVAHRHLSALSGAARNTLARDSFAYLHLPMIAGIELFALADVPVGTELNSVTALAVACALVAALLAYETVRFAGERARVRMGA